MRKQLLVVLLPLLVLSAMVVTASAATDTTNHATLQKVDVVRGDDGVNVELTSRGQVTPTVSTLDSPARVVVSLPNTVAATAKNHLNVDGNGVKGVRIGMDGHTPPTTSVVIDLLNACTYELVPGNGGKVIVRLHAAAGSAKAAKPAAAPHAVITPASMHRTAVVTPALQAQAAISAPAATLPVSAEKPAQAASAKDYVFVEPSYQAKPASQGSEPAMTAPEVRASEAAAKFVDKPEGSLLPAPSAAMQQTSQAPNTTTMQPAVNLAAEQRVQASQVVSTPEPKYTGEPISVNLKDVD
ncbi:MAG: AMIN domain-containing protein, partial [Gaiellaceae bacterium]